MVSSFTQTCLLNCRPTQSSRSVHWTFTLDVPQAPPSLHSQNSSFPLCFFYSRSIYDITIHSDAQVRNWESFFLDFLFFLFPHILFVQSYKFYLLLSLKYTCFLSFLLPPFYLTWVTAIVSLLQVLPSLIHYPAGSQSHQKYKHNQWCCSFENFQWFPVLSTESLPSVLTSNPWEDQCFGKQGSPYLPHYPKPIASYPCCRGRWLGLWFSVLELKSHLTLVTILYKSQITQILVMHTHHQFKRETS